MDTRIAVQNAMLTNALRMVGDSTFETEHKHLSGKLRDDVEEWRSSLANHQHNAFDKSLKKTGMIFIDLSFNAQTGENCTVKLCALLFMCMQSLPIDKTDRLCEVVAEVSDIMFKQHGGRWTGLSDANALEKPFKRAVYGLKDLEYFADLDVDVLFDGLFLAQEEAA